MGFPYYRKTKCCPKTYVFIFDILLLFCQNDEDRAIVNHCGEFVKKILIKHKELTFFFYIKQINKKETKTCFQKKDTTISFD